MSLNFITVSANMNNTYTALKTDTQADNANQVPYPKAPGTKWVDDFKLYYNSNSMAGTFSQASVIMVSLPALLSFVNTSNSCAGAADNMAKAISDYWVAQITKGAPQVYTIITSVTNDASKISATIKSYLCSQVSTSKSPNYEHIFQYIENQVKTIIWTVNETNGTLSTSYTVSIS